jgi:hypothetical protein
MADAVRGVDFTRTRGIVLDTPNLARWWRFAALGSLVLMTSPSICSTSHRGYDPQRWLTWFMALSSIRRASHGTLDCAHCSDTRRTSPLHELYVNDFLLQKAIMQVHAILGVRASPEATSRRADSQDRMDREQG